MKVKADTIARTIVLFIALANQMLAIFGKGTLEITEDQVYQAVSLALTVGATAAAWWHNNSFTKAAIKADEVMKAEKAAEKESK